MKQFNLIHRKKNLYKKIIQFIQKKYSFDLYNKNLI